jgi:hypothetical protein
MTNTKKYIYVEKVAKPRRSRAKMILAHYGVTPIKSKEPT